jgi:hypothetical protein
LITSCKGREPEFAQTDVKFKTALIVGAGAACPASLARALSGTASRSHRWRRIIAISMRW